MKPLNELPHGPLSDRTVHVCIDMQNLFVEETPWHTPWMNRVLPVIAVIAERHAAQTIFTRFVPPRNAEEAGGAWRRYYRRWRDLTLEKIDPKLIDLAPPLAALAPPAEVVDKHVYSAFFEASLIARLRERR